YGLYAYMYGTFTGGLFSSSSFMAVQATGAMAIVVADIGIVHGDGTASVLFMLSILTGAIMLVAGLLKAGSVLRFVSNAVMVGFINAVGINIILGQFDNFTGYEAEGSNRVTRAFDTLLSLGQAHWPTIAVGVATIAMIVVLGRTRLGPLGMVAAIIIGSAVPALLGWEVATLSSIADIPRALPFITMPDLGSIPALIIPAFSLAFIGLVQGAGISSNFVNPDGTYPDASQDFVGQGAANIVVGLFQGMPVGGSMSASSLVKEAGAKSRMALLIGAVVMGIVILVFGSVVGYIAMPALAGLLMTVGYGTIKPRDIKEVWRTGKTPAMVMVVTFVLTMLIALQYAVLVGVGISMILYIIKQSNRMTVKQRIIDDDDSTREVDPPDEVPADSVLLLQPYGSLFFASAPVFEEALPAVGTDTRNSVVILRLRGRDDLGSTFADVLLRYAEELDDADSKLVIVTESSNIHEQLAVARVTNLIGEENIYASSEWVGRSAGQAYHDATRWVAESGSDTSETGGADDDTDTDTADGPDG
ncbi:MAG: SulP family inorganic anion transporter, partial [Actinomycetota bacterium]|nr:SulP family inorganic anion transporter [Actinomycetota bacterium]